MEVKIKMKNGYEKTIRGCFVAYISQAIIVNFAPLLFVTFQNTYNIGLEKIAMLISVNFGVQLLVDLICVKFIDKIGYRASMLLALICCAIGLIGLVVFPEILMNGFIGLLIAVIVYAIGGGILEVLVGPIVEGCPTDNKAGVMSLLHSFYCWGHVLVVVVSTLYFVIIGIEHWRYLAIAWALIPILNAISFTKLPMPELTEEHMDKSSVKNLFRNGIFWLMILLMVCAGATEQAISQWASIFAEKGLGVSKTIGDLAGPLSFAVFMGTSRAFYGKYSEKISLSKFMKLSATLCIVSYLVASLSQSSVLGLIGCASAGLFVGIMWPGTISMSAGSIRNGGTAMFAFLALGGDLGCSLGPAVVGAVSKHFNDNLKIGILSAIIFPIILLCGISINTYVKNKNKNKQLQ